jgi:hypothetical protein
MTAQKARRLQPDGLWRANSISGSPMPIEIRTTFPVGKAKPAASKFQPVIVWTSSPGAPSGPAWSLGDLLPGRLMACCPLCFGPHKVADLIATDGDTARVAVCPDSLKKRPGSTFNIVVQTDRAPRSFEKAIANAFPIGDLVAIFDLIGTGVVSDGFAGDQDYLGHSGQAWSPDWEHVRLALLTLRRCGYLREAAELSVRFSPFRRRDQFALQRSRRWVEVNGHLRRDLLAMLADAWRKAGR